MILPPKHKCRMKTKSINSIKPRLQYSIISFFLLLFFFLLILFLLLLLLLLFFFLVIASLFWLLYRHW